MVECAPSSAPSSAPQPCRPRDLDGVYCPRTVAPGPREASPSLVYGAALLMRLGVRLPPGFKSRSLRSCGHPGPESQVDHAPVAQRIEHLTTDQKVGGSNPFGRAHADQQKHCSTSLRRWPREIMWSPCSRTLRGRGSRGRRLGLRGRLFPRPALRQPRRVRPRACRPRRRWSPASSGCRRSP